MEITFTGRHQTVSDALKDYVTSKLERAVKNIPKVNGAHVIIDSERYQHKVEVIVQVINQRIRAADKSDDLTASMDKAIDKLERQLKKYKDKLQYHRTKGKDFPVEESVEIEAEDTVRKPRLIRTKKIAPKPMDANEAFMQLQLSDEEFMVFMNAETDAISVVYKREDGNYGLIEPQGGRK